MSDLRRAAASLLLNHLAKGIDERSAELRRQIREHEARHRPAALRPLPYSHEMGPTGNPRTFGIVGGGNKSGGASPGVHTRVNAKKNGRLPAAYWDPSVRDQNRHFEALRKQRSRIKANGGKRKPPHRPRTITAEQEQRVRDLLAARIGKKKIAKLVGIGVNGVQRISRESE